MAFQIQVPKGWEVESIERRDNNRVYVSLRRPDTPAALPLVAVEDYEDKIDRTLNMAIEDWEQHADPDSLNLEE